MDLGPTCLVNHGLNFPFSLSFFFFLLNLSFVFGSLFWLSSAEKVVFGGSVFYKIFFFSFNLIFDKPEFHLKIKDLFEIHLFC